MSYMPTIAHIYPHNPTLLSYSVSKRTKPSSHCDFKVLMPFAGKQSTARKCWDLWVSLGLWPFWVFRVDNIILKFIQEHWGFLCISYLVKLTLASNCKSLVWIHEGTWAAVPFLPVFLTPESFRGSWNCSLVDRAKKHFSPGSKNRVKFSSLTQEFLKEKKNLI